MQATEGNLWSPLVVGLVDWKGEILKERVVYLFKFNTSSNDQQIKVSQQFSSHALQPRSEASVSGSATFKQTTQLLMHVHALKSAKEKNLCTLLSDSDAHEISDTDIREMYRIHRITDSLSDIRACLTLFMNCLRLHLCTKRHYWC